MPKEPETAAPPALEVLTENRSGSDFMVDVLKSLGIEYVFANPGSSFRGLHESIINYGGNKNPEFITCCHEESAVAMAHGYSKIEGKPRRFSLHGDRGFAARFDGHLQRVLRSRAGLSSSLGNTLDATMRRPGCGVGPQRAGRRGHRPRFH